MNLKEIRQSFDRLNHDYLAVHLRKEELFWSTAMGTSDDHAGFALAETEWKTFISDPARLAEIGLLHEAARATSCVSEAERVEREALLIGLQGWIAFLGTNIVEGEEGRRAMRRLVELEAELSGRRQTLVHRHSLAGVEVETNLSGLAVNLLANPDEASRKSSFKALRDFEEWVIDAGFLEIVQARNDFARIQGRRDFFDYKVQISEAMSPEELFVILDDFEERTRATNFRAFEELGSRLGPEVLEAWNYRYHMTGDVIREMDPYFPIETSLARWIETFHRLGITFRDASLQLDLLDRRGKEDNGFCHGPLPAFFDGPVWIPGRINFTASAKPNQVGSGHRSIETLFHEGGHAAHFANIAMNAPCFSQEFPPSSMALAETQSMFCDSLLNDADWLHRYAKDSRGEAMPAALIRRHIETNQPYRAFAERFILAVPYFERALYALSPSELTKDRVLALARETERRILGREASRPLLAIPHLLNQESAASYHGYLLAHMAVYQTRAWFLRNFGYLTDNPAIGPLLAEKYWAPGNSITHDQSLRALTGEGFSARYLAAECNLGVEEAWKAAEESMRAAETRSYPRDYPRELRAKLRVVDGETLLSDNARGEGPLIEGFVAEVGKRRMGEP